MMDDARGPYTICIKRSAVKDLADLHPRVRKSVDRRILRLAEDPTPQGSLPLTGEWKGFWRIRVGEHRVIYFIDEETHTITISHVRSRQRAYG